MSMMYKRTNEHETPMLQFTMGNSNGNSPDKSQKSPLVMNKSPHAVNSKNVVEGQLIFKNNITKS